MKQHAEGEKGETHAGLLIVFSNEVTRLSRHKQSASLRLHVSVYNTFIHLVGPNSNRLHLLCNVGPYDSMMLIRVFVQYRYTEMSPRYTLIYGTLNTAAAAAAVLPEAELLQPTSSGRAGHPRANVGVSWSHNRSMNAFDRSTASGKQPRRRRPVKQIIRRVRVLWLTVTAWPDRGVKPKFHYADFPETFPGGDVTGLSRTSRPGKSA